MNTSLRDLLNIFFKYSKYLIVFSVSVIIVSGIYLLFAKKIYDSNAKILIRLGTEQMGSMQFLSPRSTIIARREQELKNEAEILTSDQVISESAKKILGNDLADLKKFERVKAYLSSNLKVKTLYDSDTIDLTFKFPDPFIARKILDIIIKEYIQHHIIVFQSSEELNFLETELTKAKLYYDNSLSTLSDFMSQYKIYNNDVQINLLIEKLNALHQTLISSISDHEYNSKKLSKMLEIKNHILPFQVFSSVEVRNRHFDELKSKLTEAELEKQNLLTRYTPESRFIKDIEMEIELLQKLLLLEPDRILDQKDERKNQLFDEVEMQVIELESKVNGEMAKIAALKEQFKAVEDELERYADSFKKFNVVKTKSDFAKKEYEKIFEGFLESKIRTMTEENKITNISVIETPSLNLVPKRPPKKITIALTACILLAGSLTLLSLLSFFESTFTHPEDIKKILNLPVIGIIPFFESKLSDRLTPVKTNLREFHKIFTSLTYKKQGSNVFLVTKSYSGEGASSIALNLAYFLANYQFKKVAFVNYACNTEFDEREGTEISFSNLSKQPATASRLQFKLLDFSGVKVFHNTTKEVLSEKDAKGKYTIIQKLKEEFDWVFVNIPPVKDSFDLVFLSWYVYKVLFFVEAEKTNIQSAKYNIDILKQYGLDDISIIFNKRRFYIPEFLYKII